MERDFCGGEEERKRKAEGIPTTGEVRKRENGIKIMEKEDKMWEKAIRLKKRVEHQTGFKNPTEAADSRCLCTQGGRKTPTLYINPYKNNPLCQEFFSFFSREGHGRSSHHDSSFLSIFPLLFRPAKMTGRCLLTCISCWHGDSAE